MKLTNKRGTIIIICRVKEEDEWENCTDGSESNNNSYILQ